MCEYLGKSRLLLTIDPPEKFDCKMKTNEFLLFLNTNGISYEVCKKLKGITSYSSTVS